jgi:hypothetical protein
VYVLDEQSFSLVQCALLLLFFFVKECQIVARKYRRHPITTDGLEIVELLLLLHI